MSTPIEVLLIDDSPSDAALISEMLEKARDSAFHVTRRDRLQSGLKHLIEHHVDAILVDLSLPDSRGLQTFHEVAAAAPHVAIVVLSGLDDASVAMKAVREGAQEYLVKDQFDEVMLERSVRYAMERAATKQALTESEALYHSLVESLPLNLFRKDLEGRFVFCNQRFCQSLGVPREQIIGRRDFEFFPPEQATKYVRDDRRVIETGEMLEDFEEHHQPNGKTISVHVMKSPVRDAAGKIIGVQGMFWDVSDKKRAEAELLYERHLLHSLMDNVPDTIFFKDTEGRYLRINRALADRLGLAEPADAEGKRDTEFFPVAEAEEFGSDDDRVMQTGQTLVNKEEHKVWPDGAETWTSTTKLPLHDRKGEIAGTFGISRDITKRKKAEADLQRAKEAAEAASRAKSQFLANMSHEVRTPLNAVLGLAELVLGTDLTAQQREYLTLVHQSGESLLMLLNDILDFSKIEAGRLNLEEHPFVVRDILEEAIHLHAYHAHSQGLELICHVDPAVPEIAVGDSHRLRQVLVNLIGNAVKFTTEGEVLLNVECHSRDAERAEIAFGVSDTGVGIPSDKLARIFEVFEQADGSTTRQHGGTGLGLAISAQLVSLMGGEIQVASRFGSGSQFSFKLAFEVPDLPSCRASDKPAEFDGLRVLIVAGNQTNRLAISEALRGWSAVVSAAPTAGTAIEAISEANAAGSPFDLVLIDAGLPGGDGFELIENLDLTTRTLMMLSCNRLHEDAPRCHQASIGGYVTKPVLPRTLAAAMSAVLRGDPVPHGNRSAESGVVHLRRLRILLVEDSPVNRKLAVGLLQRYGHNVEVAGNGNEALQLLELHSFDVVLMDLQMPEMDGLQATAAIRAAERDTGQHVPIIAMTAHALKGDRERCLQAGMDEYLAKPLRARVLLEAIAAATGEEVGRVVSDRSDDVTATVAVNESDSCVDWSVALDAVNGDRGLLRGVIEEFLVECPQLVMQLRDAVDRGDWRSAGRAAHTIKGTIRHFGAWRAVAHAEELERMSGDEISEGAVREIEQLQREVDGVLAALSKFATENTEGTSDANHTYRR